MSSRGGVVVPHYLPHCTLLLLEEDFPDRAPDQSLPTAAQFGNPEVEFSMVIVWIPAALPIAKMLLAAVVSVTSM
jgi:hypothetical protein